jgi:general secretion pathway protein N
MNHRNALIACGVGSFLLCLISLLPAGVAFRILASDTFHANGLTGTLWHGEAREIQMKDIRLTRTRWNLSIMNLLLGRLAGTLETDLPGGRASGFFMRTPNGTMACRDCEISGSLDLLRPIIPIEGQGGSVAAQLKVLEYRRGWWRRAVGIVQVKDVALALPGQAAIEGARGDFETKFNADPVPDSGPLEAEVRDTAGPLQLEGKVQLNPLGAYQFDGKLKPRAGAPQALVNSVQALGPQQPDGSYSVTFAGTF